MTNWCQKCNGVGSVGFWGRKVCPACKGNKYAVPPPQSDYGRCQPSPPPPPKTSSPAPPPAKCWGCCCGKGGAL